jgi:hypothetical protein
MRLNSGRVASFLAGAGLLAPGLTFGLWALGDAPGGVELMGGPGLTLSFLLLLIAPVIIFGSGLLGRIVLAYLDEDEGKNGPASSTPASAPGMEQVGKRSMRHQS